MDKKFIKPTTHLLLGYGAPTLLHPNEALGLKVIAVTGGMGEPGGPAQDWAVYYGLLSMPDEEIIEYGDKMAEETAKLLFPGFAHLYYRA